ncbi:MAG TPA: amino acid adenylation domain-containing protein [Rhodanobacteraceae bacterium]|nr:amino acid adenylation domain-containing protein [Rhodanobacteraceae bacterium]
MSDSSPNPRRLLPVDFDPFAAADDTLPLTEPQREMSAATLMGDEANCAYNQCFVLRLHGPLSPESLRNALAEVVRRHEALRLRIDMHDERQQVLPAIGFDLPLVDLGAHDPADRDAAVARLIDRETRTPFDLGVAPLWRAQLVRETPDRHLLVFTAHHLVVDGWSSAVLFSDLAGSYAADRFGVPATLPPAASYRDFVADQHGPAIAAEMEIATEFWKSRFAEGVPAFELPLDFPRPALKTYTAGRQTLTVDNELYQALRKVAAQQKTTLFVALLAAFEILVARLSSAGELVIGVPMASQILQDNAHLVAHGVNTIPLLCRIDLRQSFSEHLQATRKAFFDAQAHQRLTFGSLVQELRLPRDPSRTPLVSVVFNIDKLGSPFDFGDVSVISVDAPKAFYNFEFGVNAIDNGESLLLECDYNADLFKAATVDRWLSHYRTLLAGITVNPASEVAALPLLADSERVSLMAAVPLVHDAARLGCDGSLVRLIATQVERLPARIAVECEGDSATYGRLWADSANVARTLIASGAKRGELIGLCTPRCIGMIVGLLGILRAGCAYVPLDRSFPDRRLRRMIERADLHRILVSARDGLPGAVEQCGANLIELTDIQDSTAPLAPLPDPAGDDLAYVLFTSGSTGEPKGVRVLHRNLVNLLLSMQQSPGLTVDDVLCAVTTLSFDIAGLELYLPLVVGAQLRLATDEEILDPLLLSGIIRDSRTSVLQTTPTLLRMMIDAGQIDCLADLRLLVGGEALPRDLANALVSRCRELWNMYGPTETTIWSALWRVPPGQHSGPLPLGGPIANTSIYLLDQSCGPVPEGVRGEIWIGGAGVADGYLGNPELTAERFRSDPFAAGGRMYRTGDVGSLRDGILHFHGRADEQVKLRGFRIELGDVEAAAYEEPRVREAAAMVHELSDGDASLVLYVAAHRDGDDPSASLRALLGDVLPPYMRPNRIVVLPFFPHTPNGKIDRKALPRPDDQAHTLPTAVSREIVAPRTDSESLVVAAFSEALNRCDVSVLDDFFELGGHSLMAARVMTRLRAAAHVDLPLRNLFERPTPERLAVAIDALVWAAADNPRAGASDNGEREEIEL